MRDLDANVGKLLLALDFVGTGTSPAIEAILPADADPEWFARAVSDHLHATLVRCLGQYETPLGEQIGVAVHPRTRIIKTRAERRAEFSRLFIMTPEQEAEAAQVREARQRAIDNHPQNGRKGWWRVEGVRHACLVRASSCREALERSSKVVGSWESPEAEWLGEELPDVVGF